MDIVINPSRSEITLTRLQGIAENYNISYDIDAKFQHLTDQQHSITEAFNATKEVNQKELDGIKFWLKKLQRKTKKLDLKISSLEGSMAERDKQETKDKKARDNIISNLTSALGSQKRLVVQLALDKKALQKALDVVQESMQRQGNKIAVLEQQLTPQSLNQTPGKNLLGSPGMDASPISAQQRMAKLQSKHSQMKRLHQEQQLLIPTKITMASFPHGRVIDNVSFPEKEEPGNVTDTMKRIKEKENDNVTERERAMEEEPLDDNVKNEKSPEQEPQAYVNMSLLENQGHDHLSPICNVDSVLVFPNASTENYITFSKGVRQGLHEMSICSWVQTTGKYMGTILSYATEENDNKLVLYGRDGGTYDALHFVIGDPVYRELPVLPFLDGSWHHTCFIWSSIQGKYWFYVDRRLVSTGSRFQKGYEIPPGGSLILGQEQDTVGGGFESSEAFVGNLAGFAVWNRALSPGEVSGIATGKGLPRGTILTLADDPTLHGFVKRVDCPCLEHCL
ncbi:hypothetical protein GDO86_017636 [Hymenochirus boettgeri]|uniref:Pentraxin (PTX) domain-containing protein n=1 Tax=Hymenochirus boettgeri TaxID=247094 RepID=A0A8T2IR50_9PIPI|nr:hypothetical protein GDO86_017636 [Hymenochirus boettgeri]